MSKRIALFASKKEMEDFFGFETGKESIFTPHYNLAPAQYVTIICKANEEIQIERARWGIDEGNNGESDVNSTVEIEQALRGLKLEKFKRCIIPVSGYYKWKKTGKRADHPFFVRMLDEAIMALAGVMIPDPEAGDSSSRYKCAIIQAESNALIYPLSPQMPLQLDKNLSQKWLDDNSDPDSVIQEAQNLFLLTDMTVLRVSKKVNDLSVNDPKLIQPLPK